MDKSQKKELKNRFREQQRMHDIAFQLWALREKHIQQASSIDKTAIECWTDEQLENKIVDYVWNQFQHARKPAKHQNRMVWERDTLVNFPLGIQAVFATYLFESDLLLNGSFWDFFYQNNGAFAMETLKGYQLMQNQDMVEIMQQCIGAYLQMKRSGEIERLIGEPHHWNMDEKYYLAITQKSFKQIDEQYQLNDQNFLNAFLATLKSRKIMFIRNNVDLFQMQK